MGQGGLSLSLVLVMMTCYLPLGIKTFPQGTQKSGNLEQKFLEPPIIKYWAYGKVNTTVIDKEGFPWYCYTYRKSYCTPMFELKPYWVVITTTELPETGSEQDDSASPSDKSQSDLRAISSLANTNTKEPSTSGNDDLSLNQPSNDTGKGNNQTSTNNSVDGPYSNTQVSPESNTDQGQATSTLLDNNIGRKDTNVSTAEIIRDQNNQQQTQEDGALNDKIQVGISEELVPSQRDHQGNQDANDPVSTSSGIIDERIRVNDQIKLDTGAGSTSFASDSGRGSFGDNIKEEVDVNLKVDESVDQQTPNAFLIGDTDQRSLQPSTLVQDLAVSVNISETDIEREEGKTDDARSLTDDKLSTSTTIIDEQNLTISEGLETSKGAPDAAKTGADPSFQEDSKSEGGFLGDKGIVTELPQLLTSDTFGGDTNDPITSKSQGSTTNGHVEDAYGSTLNQQQSTTSIETPEIKISDTEQASQTGNGIGDKDKLSSEGEQNLDSNGGQSKDGKGSETDKQGSVASQASPNEGTDVQSSRNNDFGADNSQQNTASSPSEIERIGLDSSGKDDTQNDFTKNNGRDTQRSNTDPSGSQTGQDFTSKDRISSEGRQSWDSNSGQPKDGKGSETDEQVSFISSGASQIGSDVKNSGKTDSEGDKSQLNPRSELEKNNAISIENPAMENNLNKDNAETNQGNNETADQSASGTIQEGSKDKGDLGAGTKSDSAQNEGDISKTTIDEKAAGGFNVSNSSSSEKLDKIIETSKDKHDKESQIGVDFIEYQDEDKKSTISKALQEDKKELLELHESIIKGKDNGEKLEIELKSKEHSSGQSASGGQTKTVDSPNASVGNGNLAASEGGGSTHGEGHGGRGNVDDDRLPSKTSFDETRDTSMIINSLKQAEGRLKDRLRDVISEYEATNGFGINNQILKRQVQTELSSSSDTRNVERQPRQSTQSLTLTTTPRSIPVTATQAFSQSQGPDRVSTFIFEEFGKNLTEYEATELIRQLLASPEFGKNFKSETISSSTNGQSRAKGAPPPPLPSDITLRKALDIKERRPVPPNTKLAQAYSVYGEPCEDACELRFYSYTWCHTNITSMSTFKGSDYCTTEPGVTHIGEKCTDACEKRGKPYSWCHTENGGWGYCTLPEYILFSRAWKPEPDEDFSVLVYDLQEDEPLPKAFTIRGEACSDECKFYDDYPYSWCTKSKASQKGAWVTSDYCTTSSNVTADGQVCITECGFNGFNYAWCKTEDSFGYCTPSSFLNFLDKLDQSKKIALDSGKRVTGLNITDLPPYWDKAQSFSIYGEACWDTCERRDNTRYTWCHKFEPSRGSWRFSEFCTNDPKVTPFGEECIDECEQRGQYYYWCNKSPGLWGYCTPKKLLNLLHL